MRSSQIWPGLVVCLVLVTGALRDLDHDFYVHRLMVDLPASAHPGPSTPVAGRRRAARPGQEPVR